jgi:hypothetical protein
MANLIYYEHVIVSTGIYDELTKRWKISAFVSWAVPGTPPRRIHFIRNTPERFARLEDAEIAGVESAKGWVVSRLQEIACD